MPDPSSWRETDLQQSSIELESNDHMENSDSVPDDSKDGARQTPTARKTRVSWKQGVFVITSFFISFIIIMVLRGTLANRPLLFSLFSNMYLAGTIIFGGGPVVIPLLRE